jgi:hypothetical protein
LLARCATASIVAALLLPQPLVSQSPLTTQREFILPTPGLGVGNAVIELRGGGFAAVGYADFGGPTGTDVLPGAAGRRVGCASVAAHLW